VKAKNKDEKVERLVGPFLKLTFHEKVRRTEKMGEEAKEESKGRFAVVERRERERGGEKEKKTKARRVVASRRVSYSGTHSLFLSSPLSLTLL